MEEMILSSGIVSSGLTIGSGCSLCIESGGTAVNTTIKRGGTVFLGHGGTVLNLNAEQGAIMELSISPGTQITGASGGVAFESKDGILSGYTVCSGNCFWAKDGKVTDMTVKNGGKLIIYGSIPENLRPSFSIGDSEVDDIAIPGGSAVNTTVCSGGKLIISAYGRAHDATILTGGILEVNRHGDVLGEQCEKGAIVLRYDRRTFRYDNTVDESDQSEK